MKQVSRYHDDVTETWASYITCETFINLSVTLPGPLQGMSYIRCCKESVTRIKWATTWIADTRLTFVVYLQNGLTQQNIISQVNSAFPDAPNRMTHRRGMDLFSSKVYGCRIFSKKQVETEKSVHLKPVILLIGEFKDTGWMSRWAGRGVLQVAHSD